MQSKNHHRVNIVGLGLAGCEAAYQLLKRGIAVRAYEMRPKVQTEAHQSADWAELVCSNSLKSKDEHSAPGLLKEELRQLDSIVLRAGFAAEVPGGQSLTVDRVLFSRFIMNELKSFSSFEVLNEEFTGSDLSEPTLLATGPLTSPALARWIQQQLGEEDLYFYDAIAPIVEAESINRKATFLANRYGKGGEDAYVNCPLNQEQYIEFVTALLSGQTVPPKNFEKEILFQGCQPIESIAARGRETLRYGPMKPVGLIDPHTGQRPYAVLQLRPENLSASAYNCVGFQTKLKYGEQDRIFRLIPALRDAQFLRMGSIHRNTFICAPRVLAPAGHALCSENLYFAGQVAGVEGYLESAAMGLWTALQIAQRHFYGVDGHTLPKTTAMGALRFHVHESEPKYYQPNNMQFGLLDRSWFQLDPKWKKDAIRAEQISQMQKAFAHWRLSSEANEGAGHK